MSCVTINLTGNEGSSANNCTFESVQASEETDCKD